MFFGLILLMLISFGIGYVFHRDLYLDKNPEPPLLDTPENVLNYLEACSLDQNNPEMNELFGEFRVFVNQKQLPSNSSVEGWITLKEEKKPEWFHNPDAELPYEEHWNTFLKDLQREEDSKARVNVVRHWMLDLKNGFTYKEMEMILDYFDNSEDRAAVREIYAGKRKEKKAKKKA